MDRFERTICSMTLVVADLTLYQAEGLSHRKMALWAQAARQVEDTGDTKEEALEHVGLVVWQSAFLLAELLARRPPFGGWSDVRCVDLGTGTGRPFPPVSPIQPSAASPYLPIQPFPRFPVNLLYIRTAALHLSCRWRGLPLLGPFVYAC